MLPDIRPIKPRLSASAANALEMSALKHVGVSLQRRVLSIAVISTGTVNEVTTSQCCTREVDCTYVDESKAKVNEIELKPLVQ